MLRLPSPSGVVGATHPAFIKRYASPAPLEVVEQFVRGLLSHNPVPIVVCTGRCLDDLSVGHVDVVLHDLFHLGDLDVFETSTLQHVAHLLGILKFLVLEIELVDLLGDLEQMALQLVLLVQGLSHDLWFLFGFGHHIGDGGLAHVELLREVRLALSIDDALVGDVKLLAQIEPRNRLRFSSECNWNLSRLLFHHLFKGPFLGRVEALLDLVG
jgi:hypothetical protein